MVNNLKQIVIKDYSKNLPTNLKLGVVEKRQEKNLMVLLKISRKLI